MRSFKFGGGRDKKEVGDEIDWEYLGRKDENRESGVLEIEGSVL